MTRSLLPPSHKSVVIRLWCYPAGLKIKWQVLKENTDQPESLSQLGDFIPSGSTVLLSAGMSGGLYIHLRQDGCEL